MKQVNLRIYRMILPLLMGLFLSVSVYAQNITVKGHVKDALGGVLMSWKKVIPRMVQSPTLTVILH